jgi:hypothetical protein
MLGAFEVAVEILVWTDHQQLQRVLIQDAVGEQAHPHHRIGQARRNSMGGRG